MFIVRLKSSHSHPDYHTNLIGVDVGMVKKPERDSDLVCIYTLG